MIYKISDDDWDEIKRLSAEANRTPVMFVGSVDLSLHARERVFDKWKEIGNKMGFKWDTARPAGEQQVEAEPK